MIKHSRTTNPLCTLLPGFTPYTHLHFSPGLQLFTQPAPYQLDTHLLLSSTIAEEVASPVIHNCGIVAALEPLQFLVLDPDQGSFELLESDLLVDYPSECCDPYSRFESEESDEENTVELDLAFIEQVKVVSSEMVKASEAPETVLIEVNRLKFARTQSFSNCARGVLQGLLASVQGCPERHFERWGSFLARYTITSEIRQLVIEELERAVTDTAYSAYFHVLVKALYQQDVLEEANILQWSQDSNSRYLRTLMKPFVDWLLEDSQEDEE